MTLFPYTTLFRSERENQEIQKVVVEGQIGKKDVQKDEVELAEREMHNKKAEIHVVSELVPRWVQEVKDSYEQDDWAAELKRKLEDSRVQLSPHHLTEYQGVIKYKGRICIGNNGDWRQKIMHELHGSCLGGHSGITATYQRIKKQFYWPKLKEAVHSYVQACTNCHLNKGEHVPSPGLLQPLPVPAEAWSSIGMDFITGLPKSKGYEVIFVVVDRLTKYAHFIGLAHPFTASTVAQA